MKAGTSALVWGGTYFGFFSWLIGVSWRLHDYTTAGIITGLMVALCIWTITSLRRRAGIAALQTVAWHLTFIWTAVLVILNLSLPTWIGLARGTTPAEVHHLLPVWLIPLLTLALVVWAGLVMVATKPARRG